MKTLPRLYPALRTLSWGDVASVATWAVCLVALEAWGREVDSDVGDALGILTLATLVGATALGVRTGRVHWPRVFARPVQRAREALRRRAPDLGIDLRQEPPVPPGTPPLVRDVLVVLGALVLGDLALLHRLPHALRDGMAPVSYLLYLTVLGVLWAALMAGGLFALFTTLFWVHDRFVERRLDPARDAPDPRAVTAHPREPLAHAAVLACVALGALALPAWVGLALAAAALLATAWLHRRSSAPAIVLLWRARRQGSEPRSLSWRRSMLSQLAATGGAILVLGLSAAGADVLPGRGTPAGPLRLTPVLGTLFTWAAAAGCTVLFLQARRSRRAAGRFRRAAERPPALWLAVGAEAVDVEALRERLAGRGWRASFAPEPAPDDAVRAELCPDAEVADDPLRLADVFRTGRRRVSPSQLDDPAQLATLARAREIHLRRRLAKGLATLLKQAARRSYERGSGTWIAPQYWFVTGISRDESEEEQGSGDYLFETILGAPFERVLPWAARAHFHTVTRALEVDLIFLEDGVGHRRLRRVLDVLFEVYDVHGGRVRLEERHLSGLVGLRPVIHEVELGRPFRRKGYPEPDYEDLARARILHVFKDRGGDQDETLSPSDVRDRPVLVPAL